jgi:hypothetical protein
VKSPFARLDGLYFAVSETVLNKQVINQDINAFPDIFYTSSRGVNEINIVISSSVNKLVDKHFVNEKLIQKLDNLASILLNCQKKILLPESIISFFNVALGLIINEVSNESYHISG